MSLQPMYVQHTRPGTTHICTYAFCGAHFKVFNSQSVNCPLLFIHFFLALGHAVILNKSHHPSRSRSWKKCGMPGLSRSLLFCFVRITVINWWDGPLATVVFFALSLQVLLVSSVVQACQSSSTIFLLPWPKKSLQPRNSWGWSTVRSCDIVRYRASVSARTASRARVADQSRCRCDITWSHWGSISWISRL